MPRRVLTVAVAVMIMGGLISPAQADEPPTTVPTITAPSNNAAVSGQIQVKATSSAPFVRFSLDTPAGPDPYVQVPVNQKTRVATANLRTAGYNGRYPLRARDCVDAETCNDTAASITLNVDNKVPPNIITPYGQQTYNFWQPVVIEVGVNAGAVRIMVTNSAGKTVFDTTDIVRPYGAVLDVTHWVDGEYTINATTCDLTGVVCEGATTKRGFTVRGLGLSVTRPDNRFFSPNGDGVRDTADISYTLTRRSDVYFEIRDGQGQVLSQGLLENGVRIGPHEVHWDGKVNGKPLPDGAYTYVLKAILPLHPERVEQKSTQWVIDRVAPKMKLPVQSAKVVYPYRDGFHDYVDLKTGSESKNATLSLRIASRSGATMYLRTFATKDPRNVSVRWRGRSNGGQLLPNGQYSVIWRLSDRAGNSVVARDKVTVSDKRLITKTVTVSVDGRKAYDWSVGKCSAVRPNRDDSRAMNYLSDQKCNSRPYRTNKKHLIIGYYRVKVPNAYRYAGATFVLNGGALAKRSVAWESVWLAEQNKWARARYASSPSGNHIMDKRGMAQVDEKGYIYMAVLVGEGNRYKVSRLLVQIRCTVLESPHG